MYACVYVCKCICICKCICTCICIFICICTCICTCICVCVCVCVCIHVYMYTCVYVYTTWTTNTYICIYTFVEMSLTHVPLPSSQASQTHACALAAAICEEMNTAGTVPVESQQFLSTLARLSTTHHEHRMPEVLEKHGLQAAIATTWLDIGLSSKHPVIRIQDFLKCLSKEKKVTEILLQQHKSSDYEQFWELYQVRHPLHPVYEHHRGRLHLCVPLFLHCDEGTGAKKRG